MKFGSRARHTSGIWFSAGLWIAVAAGPPAHAQDASTRPAQALHGDLEHLEALAGGAAFDVPCREGMADAYPCRAVDLLALLPANELGGAGHTLNDVWGWTDPETGREYAIVGLRNGTAFVDVSVPEASVFLGQLPTQVAASSWHDMKVYADHAYIVSEAAQHGMQVFDLRQLRDVVETPAAFSPTAHYSEGGLQTTHNIAIDEQSGFAYLVGSNTCGGGLHVADLREPARPRFAGCATEEDVHDAQCVVYDGTDAEWVGRQICFNSSGTHLAVVDVTDKSSPVELGRVRYEGLAFAHQSWITGDQLYMLSDDEADELQNGTATRTFIWSLANLERPNLIGRYTAATAAIDHNLYIRDGYAFQANYNAGLRVLDLSRIAEGELSEVAYFDVNPETDAAGFDGSWSVYPFFPSGTVLLSGITRGLFVLRPQLP